MTNNKVQKFFNSKHKLIILIIALFFTTIAFVLGIIGTVKVFSNQPKKIPGLQGPRGPQGPKGDDATNLSANNLRLGAPIHYKYFLKNPTKSPGEIFGSLEY